MLQDGFRLASGSRTRGRWILIGLPWLGGVTLQQLRAVLHAEGDELLLRHEPGDWFWQAIVGSSENFHGRPAAEDCALTEFERGKAGLLRTVDYYLGKPEI